MDEVEMAQKILFDYSSSPICEDIEPMSSTYGGASGVTFPDGGSYPPPSTAKPCIVLKETNEEYETPLVTSINADPDHIFSHPGPSQQSLTYENKMIRSDPWMSSSSSQSVKLEDYILSGNTMFSGNTMLPGNSPKLTVKLVPPERHEKKASSCKDRRRTADKAGVLYKLPCADCPSVYIGETGRQVKDRMKENLKAIEKKKQVSKVYSYVEETGHSFNFENVSVLDYSSSTSARKYLEGVHTHLHLHSINRAITLPQSFQAIITHHRSN